MTTFVTSDHHFGHTNIIKYCHRPFLTVEQMDAEMIASWNRRVAPNDVVWHLGDFTLKNSNYAQAYLSQLNGQINILPGSHDSWLATRNRVYTSAQHTVNIWPMLHSFKTGLVVDGYSLRIVLCHYAMRVWENSHYGSIHLYGHSHGMLPGIGRSGDVGVDVAGPDGWNYAPLPLDHVIETLLKIPVVKEEVEE